ncbi:hypothetical protein V8B97DRAFT_1878611, partial [Scleroderma yunnanense]
GFWVKTGICSHIPLSCKGQFATLKAHWVSKACTKSMATQENMGASHFALATIFPVSSQSVSSVGTQSSLNSPL